MTKGDAGQNISKFATSSTEASPLTTSLPYISYIDLASWLQRMYNHALDAVNQYLEHTGYENATPSGFKEMIFRTSEYKDVFICDGYRLCRAAKLLMSLGYGNFSNVIRYDIYAMAMEFTKGAKSWDVLAFRKSPYFLDFSKFEYTSVSNSPNLSILPLLAYHKICNDHYRNEKWQPFEPWTCNIDYLSPTRNITLRHSLIVLC